jgi:aryl-alcohol dehydrogenase-like predicted oxidoreductase
LFALAKRKPLGIIVRVPFDEGALTGQITAKTVFPAGDWRAGYFAGDRKAEAERRAKALAAMLDGEVETLPELALRFCISAPEVSAVIPGMRRPPHVRQNTLAVAKGPLATAMLAKLKQHAWDKNWYPED